MNPTTLRRPRGRPHVAEANKLQPAVSLRLVPRDHDRLFELATAEGVSVAAYARGIIVQRLATKKD